jgi:hypothetical protein
LIKLYFDATIIKAALKVGINAQNPGKRQSSFKYQIVVKIAIIAKTDNKLFTNFD